MLDMSRHTELNLMICTLFSWHPRLVKLEVGKLKYLPSTIFHLSSFPLDTLQGSLNTLNDRLKEPIQMSRFRPKYSFTLVSN